jgi:hypothetical protein
MSKVNGYAEGLNLTPHHIALRTRAEAYRGSNEDGRPHAFVYAVRGTEAADESI